MFTDRMRKAIKKLVLAKTMQEASNKLPNLQTGDHGDRKNLKTSKSLSYYLKKAKRVQEKRQAIERAIENLSQEYQAFEAEISDTMSQMSEDENKSRSSTKTREISTQTESEEERSPDHLIRHVPEEFMLTASPRAAPRAAP